MLNISVSLAINRYNSMSHIIEKTLTASDFNSLVVENDKLKNSVEVSKLSEGSLKPMLIRTI